MSAAWRCPCEAERAQMVPVCRWIIQLGEWRLYPRSELPRSDRNDSVANVHLMMLMIRCFLNLLNKQVSEGGLPNLSLSNQVLKSRMGHSVAGSTSWVNLRRAAIFALMVLAVDMHPFKGYYWVLKGYNYHTWKIQNKTEQNEDFCASSRDIRPQEDLSVGKLMQLNTNITLQWEKKLHRVEEGQLHRL